MLRVPLTLLWIINSVISADLSPKLTKVWGPGLKPDDIVMPARYFFIQAVDKNNKRSVLLCS